MQHPFTLLAQDFLSPMQQYPRSTLFNAKPPLAETRPANSAQLALAARLVNARQHALAPVEVNDLPSDLLAAYAVQDAAIARWPDRVAGWKVGYIALPQRDMHPDERLLGPIFSRTIWPANGASVQAPVFAPGGFGAIEAEYVLRLDTDIPVGQGTWSAEEAAAVPSTLFTGVEIASSPLAAINARGPCAVVADFGNNNGLVIGDEIADWPRLDEANLQAETYLDGILVGQGGAQQLPGGLRAALAFALNRVTQRGYRLRKGQWIATGNATGIHDILPGQQARVVFHNHGEISVQAIAASAQQEQGESHDPS